MNRMIVTNNKGTEGKKKNRTENRGKNRGSKKNTYENRILIKFNSINLIHQANANQIIIVTTNDVQFERSFKCTRDSSIKSIPKLFEITN